MNSPSGRLPEYTFSTLYVQRQTVESGDAAPIGGVAAASLIVGAVVLLVADDGAGGKGGARSAEDQIAFIGRAPGIFRYAAVAGIGAGLSNIGDGLATHLLGGHAIGQV